PTAGPPLGSIDLQRHSAGITRVERPSALVVTPRCDQADRLGHALLGLHAGAPQVVQSAQHIVVPPCWKGEARPDSTALAIPRDRFAGRQSPEEAALQKIFLSPQARRPHLRAAAPGRLVLEQRLEYADGGVER